MKTQKRLNHAKRMVVIMALFLSGCGVTVQTLVYDKPIQENQSAFLIIPSAYTVTNFDGRPVKWRTSLDGFSLSERAAAIKLPSGKHTIAYRYYRHEAGQTSYDHYASGAVVQRRTASRTTAFDENITITMESGKRYIFEGRKIVIATDNNYDQLP